VRDALADPDGLRRDGLALQQQVASDWTLQSAHLRAWLAAWTRD